MEKKIKRDDASKKKLLNYVATSAVALVMVFIVCLAKSIFSYDESEMIMRILCDAFFVPGIVLFCFGLLTVFNSVGTFDGLAFSFKAMARVAKNYRNDESQPKTYYDYKESVKGKRKVAWHLLIVGGIVAAIGIILTIIHSHMFY